MIAEKIFLTKGIGIHKNSLFSFELALRDAGIEGCNLVLVSSIFPPGCKVIDKEKGLKYLRDGAVTFCVMAKNKTNEDKLISSSVGLCFAKNTNCHGYLFENCSTGKNVEKCGQRAEDLAEEMLVTYLDNLQVKLDKKTDILKTNICQSVRGKKKLWTTTIAVAVFIKK